MSKLQGVTKSAGRSRIQPPELGAKPGSPSGREHSGARPVHRFADIPLFHRSDAKSSQVIQRVTYGDEVKGAFSADSPPTGAYPPVFYKKKFYGREFKIEATFNPDRVDKEDGKYLTGEYRQFIRGYFKAGSQILSHKLADGKTLHATNWEEDGHVSAGKYGYRTKPDNHGKYKDLGEGEGSKYTATDIPSIPVDKGETVEMNLEFKGQLVVTNEKSVSNGTVLDERTWTIAGTCKRNKKGDVVQARALGARLGHAGAPVSLTASGPGSELPEALRTSAEKISGFSLGSVSVHYDSPQPARLNARALASGNQIHIGPGQEKHLAHETWHVVQQMQGRVKPAGALASLRVNDEPSLEREADSMATRLSGAAEPRSPHSRTAAAGNVAQLKPVSDLLGTVISGEDHLKALAAGYYASQQRVELNSAWSGDLILREKLAANYLTADAWKNLDIPDEWCDLIAQFPKFYLPTTSKIWKDLFTRIATSRGRLQPVPKKDVDLSTPARDESVDAARKGILEGVASKSGKPSGKALSAKEDKLYRQIMGGEITFNFPLDRLFVYKAPSLLNAFEVGEKIGRKEHNISGDLEAERMAAEKKHFDLDEVKINPRIRPRYAALNFKGHPTGAAARNDYGLSYMILSPSVRPFCTITPGDTFDTENVYPFTPDGIANMVKAIFADPYADPSITEDGEYKSSDAYLDVQIHKDIDFRSDVKTIRISHLEMNVFDVKLKDLDEAIANLTGHTFARI